MANGLGVAQWMSACLAFMRALDLTPNKNKIYICLAALHGQPSPAYVLACALSPLTSTGALQ